MTLKSSTFRNNHHPMDHLKPGDSRRKRRAITATQRDDDRNDDPQSHSWHQPYSQRCHSSREVEKRVESDGIDMHPTHHGQQGRQHFILKLPSFLQCIALMTMISSMRMVWISTHQHLADMPREYALVSVPSQNNLFPSSRSLVGRSRRTRTRPNIPTSQAIAVNYSLGDTLQSIYPSISTTHHLGKGPVCRRGNPTVIPQRILISGILTHPVAAELALTLVDRCKVLAIAGLAEHLLSVEQSQRLEFLMRKIPQLRIHVSKYPLNDRAMMQLVTKLEPTIIFHFEPLSFISSDEDLDIFATRTSIEQLARLCKIIAAKQQHHQSSPKLIYMDPMPFPKSLSYQDHFSPMHSILLRTYRFKFGIDAIQLKLPTIFGPFREGATYLGLTDVKSNFLNSPLVFEEPLIHISDAVYSIIASAGIIESNDDSILPVLSSPQSQQSTLGQLNRALEGIYRSTSLHTKSLNHSSKIYPIISWLYHQMTPQNENLGNLSNLQAIIQCVTQTKRLLSDGRDKTSFISQLERRQNRLFPCVSECQKASIPCTAYSVWESVVSISKMSTMDCRYLVYTSNFSASFTELPEVIVSVNNATWPRDYVCQIAYVSSQSSVVRNAIGLNTSTTLENGNGRIESNGWRLVWVDGNDETLSEADYMLPKIAPLSLFSGNVSKAAYIEPWHMTTVPPLQILCFLMGRRMYAKAKPAKTGYRQGRSFEIPSVPEKQITLLGHTSDFPESAFPHSSHKNYTTHLAELILSQKAIVKHKSFSPWPSRQLQAYAKTLQWQKEEMSFHPIDTFLVVHNMAYKQSQRLRCHWYEEQLFWSSSTKRRNRDLEDLSLSFVLHRWRLQGWLDTFYESEEENRWGDRVLVEDKRVVSEGRANTPIEFYIKLHHRMKARRVYHR